MAESGTESQRMRALRAASFHDRIGRPDERLRRRTMISRRGTPAWVSAAASDVPQLPRPMMATSDLGAGFIALSSTASSSSDGNVKKKLIEEMHGEEKRQERKKGCDGRDLGEGESPGPAR